MIVEGRVLLHVTRQSMDISGTRFQRRVFTVGRRAPRAQPTPRTFSSTTAWKVPGRLASGLAGVATPTDRPSDARKRPWSQRRAGTSRTATKNPPWANWRARDAA